ISIFAPGLAGLAGDFAGHDRHQRALVRPHLADHLEQVGARIPLDVELDVGAPRRQEGGDVVDVAAVDVPFVGARMDRDAGRPRPAPDRRPPTRSITAAIAGTDFRSLRSFTRTLTSTCG